VDNILQGTTLSLTQAWTVVEPLRYYKSKVVTILWDITETNYAKQKLVKQGQYLQKEETQAHGKKH